MRIVILSLLALAFLGTEAHAQTQGFRFQLNNRVIETNSNVMSGPGGCNSLYIERRTGRPACPADRVATPQTVWMAHIRNFCGLRDTSDICIGAVVATPGKQFYLVIDEDDQPESNEVRINEIHQMGDCLEIVRRGDRDWDDYAVFHVEQQLPYGTPRSSDRFRMVCRNH